MLSDAKATLRRVADRLQQLVRRHVRLEVARVPHLAHQLAKALHQRRAAEVRGRAHRVAIGIVFRTQKVVAQRRDAHQRLDAHVDRVVHLDVVEANQTGKKLGAVLQMW